MEHTVFIWISAQPWISVHLEKAPILKAEKFNKRPASDKRPPPPQIPPPQTQKRAHPLSGPFHPKNLKKVLIRDLPEDGVFFRVFYRNLALLHLRVLLLPFIVLLQN